MTRPPRRLLHPLHRVLRAGLGRRLALSFSLLITVIILGLVVNNSRIQAQLVKSRMDQQIGHLLDLATEVSLPALLDGQPAELETIFEQWSNQEEIADIFLVDARDLLMVDAGHTNQGKFLTRVDDALVVQARRSGRLVRYEDEVMVRLAQPIIAGPTHHGTIRVNLLRETWTNNLRELWRGNLIFGGLVLAIGLTLSLAIAARIVGPLDHLTRATRQAAAGQLNQRIDIQTGDELQSLATSFNAMLQALRRAMQATAAVAYRDRLTGTPNRNWLNATLDGLVAQAGDEGQDLAVLFLDLDWFKTVNDTHGHHAGDQLLLHFAERLRGCVGALGLSIHDGESPLPDASGDVEVDTGFDRGTHKGFHRGPEVDHNGHSGLDLHSTATIARLGGDEFTIVTPADQAEQLAQLILKRMDQPFQLDAVRFRTTASIGIALYPNHAANAEDLLKQADVAMYQAKQAGRNTYCFYDEEHHAQFLQRQALIAELRDGIAMGDLVLHLQPQLDLTTRQISGIEVLLRWQHPKRGLLSPSQFLPFASDSGLMPAIGERVAGLMFDLAGRLAEAGLAPPIIAMNLSGEELADADLINTLLRCIDKASVPGTRIELEISERTATSGETALDDNLARLRDAGYRLAVDDFGIGYSNLGRLKDMRFDRLKIDRSLLDGIGADARAERLLGAVLQMLISLDKEVVAEGVETLEQLVFLKAHGCHSAQGFLLAEPMAEDAYRTWLAATQQTDPA